MRRTICKDMPPRMVAMISFWKPVSMWSGTKAFVSSGGLIGRKTYSAGQRRRFLASARVTGPLYMGMIEKRLGVPWTAWPVER